MTPTDRGERARQILEDPVFRQVFADLRESLVRQLEQSAMADVDTQHEIALSLQLLGRLRTQLGKYVDDGKVEHAKQEQARFMDRARQSIAKWR